MNRASDELARVPAASELGFGRSRGPCVRYRVVESPVLRSHILRGTGKHVNTRLEYFSRGSCCN